MNLDNRSFMTYPKAGDVLSIFIHLIDGFVILLLIGRLHDGFSFDVKQLPGYTPLYSPGPSDLPILNLPAASECVASIGHWAVSVIEAQEQSYRGKLLESPSQLTRVDADGGSRFWKSYERISVSGQVGFQNGKAIVSVGSLNTQTYFDRP